MSSDAQFSGKRSKKPKCRIAKKQKLDTDSLISDEQESANNSSEDEEDNAIDWKKLEEVLEESAQKANLTAINVKSILHVRSH